MSPLSKLDTHHKQSASLGLIMCLGIGLSLWLLAQLGHMSSLPAGPGQPPGSAAQSGYADARLVARVTIAVMLGAAVLLALWLRGEVARPLKEATTMARQVADGNLSGQIALHAAGESGQLLASMQAMNNALAAMVVKVRAGTESIAGSAGQVAAGSVALSSRIGEQLASLGQTAASVDQVTATVREQAEQAKQAGVLAASSAEAACQGGAAVADLADTMAALEHATRRIADLIGVIDAIARESKVLALNAAVEAARVGDQGRPIAILAAEVRNLAQRSAGAASDIKLLIDDARKQVGAGTHLADKAAARMHDIVSSISKVTDCIGNITDVGAGQAASLLQIDYAIAAMDRATQHTAALTAHTAAAAAAMREQAASLSRTTAAFVLGPEHGPRQRRLHLVASNPDQVPAAGTGRAARMRAVVALAPKPMRPRHAWARSGNDWEEF